MTILKRFVSVFLILALCLCISTVTVFAADVDNFNVTPIHEEVNRQARSMLDLGCMYKCGSIAEITDFVYDPVYNQFQYWVRCNRCNISWAIYVPAI